jgi:hypothetical protein
MFHDGQHSRFNDRHRQQADACGLTPGLHARSAQKGAVPGFLPVPVEVHGRVLIAVHDVAAGAAHGALGQRHGVAFAAPAACLGAGEPLVRRHQLAAPPVRLVGDLAWTSPRCRQLDTMSFSSFAL